MVLAAAGMLVSCSRHQAPPPPPKPDVAVIVVATKPVVLTTELPGRTYAYRIAEIRPQVSGVIQKRLFTEGADVKAGQELYQIDPAPFQAALDNARAALGRAQANLPAVETRVQRYKEALADKAVSRQDYDDADAALNQARADVEYWKAMVQTAQINLGYARVDSPISGRIGKSEVTDGAIVTAYQPLALASIQQLDPIYVDVPQSTTELLRLQRRLKDGRLTGGGTHASEVKLLLPDGTQYEGTGTLQFRDVSVDPTTASVILRMVFRNANSVLLPGMFVRAIVEEGANQQAILIPQQTVSRDPKGNPVALVVNADNKVEQRKLVLDRAIGDQWLVSSGLAPGERLITEGLQKVRPGAEVNVVGSEPAKPAAAPQTAAGATK
jgi:membrane fusion protein (multidrug efflux system)